MKIAVCQMDAALGAFIQNKDKIVRYSAEAQKQGCDLVIFPEAALCGYPASDVLEWPLFVRAQMAAFKTLQKQIPEKITIIFGMFMPNGDEAGRPFLNSVAILRKGKSPQFVHKALLPEGDIFDEGRYLQEFNKSQNRIVRGLPYRGVITICEEIWAWAAPRKRNMHVKNPLKSAKNGKVDFVINLSASPFYLGKIKERQYMAAKTAQFFKAPMLYVNRTGAQDELIFDGRSFALSAQGKVFQELPAFWEGLSYFKFDPKKGLEPFDKDSTRKGKIDSESGEKSWDLLRKSLVEGIRVFYERNGFQRIHLGLSGGVDSALVVCLAVEAIGKQNVTAVALPTQFNKPESLILAKKLSENLGIEFIEFPIQSLYQSAKQQLDSTFGISEFGLVHENLQARLRGVSLMAYSNFKRSLLLSTSNKSEYAVGYSTLYGDMCGGLAPIGDLTKQQVYGLCNHINRQSAVIPQEIIDRAPSAELRENQKDQDSLPAYEVLDPIVDKAVIHPTQIKESEIEKWTMDRMIHSEFKRWQAPPILKVSMRSFGKGRRWPITLTLEETQ